MSRIFATSAGWQMLLPWHWVVEVNRLELKFLNAGDLLKGSQAWFVGHVSNSCVCLPTDQNHHVHLHSHLNIPQKEEHLNPQSFLRRLIWLEAVTKSLSLSLSVSIMAAINGFTVLSTIRTIALDSRLILFDLKGHESTKPGVHSEQRPTSP